MKYYKTAIYRKWKSKEKEDVKNENILRRQIHREI